MFCYVCVFCRILCHIFLAFLRRFFPQFEAKLHFSGMLVQCRGGDGDAVLSAVVAGRHLVGQVCFGNVMS